MNPVPRTSRMVSREERVFSSTATRAALTRSHWKSDQRLKSSTLRFSGRHVIDNTGEQGTSRTYSNPHCGRWQAILGVIKTFFSPYCRVKVDGDVRGARGNALAALDFTQNRLADATSNDAD